MYLEIKVCEIIIMKRKLFGTEGSEQQIGEKKKKRKNASEIPKHYPLSERQQMALLKRMTSAENSPERSSPPPGSKKTPGSSRKDKINKRNERGETALHLHTIRGDLDGLVHLIEMGADVNAQDFAGWTPLHEACNHGYEDIARYLLEAGANVNSRGLEDDTPLHDAVTNANYEVVELLLKHGANPLLPNSHGERPVDVADSDEIRKLLESEIIVSEESDNDSTISTVIPKPPGEIRSKDDNLKNRISLDSDDAINVKIKPNRKHFLSSDSESEKDKGYSETETDNYLMKRQTEKSKMLQKTPLLSATPTKTQKISHKQYHRPFSESSSDSEATSSKYIKEKNNNTVAPKCRNILKSGSSEDEFHAIPKHVSNKSKPHAFIKQPRKISGSSTCSNDTFYSSECKSESIRTKSNPDESVYDFSPSADDYTNDVDEIHLKPSKTKISEAKTLWENFATDYPWETRMSEVALQTKKSDPTETNVLAFLSKANRHKPEDHLVTEKHLPKLGESATSTPIKQELETQPMKHSSKEFKLNTLLSDTNAYTTTSSKSLTNLTKISTPGDNIKIKKKKQKHKPVERSLSMKTEHLDGKKTIETPMKDESKKKLHKEKHHIDDSSKIKDSPNKSTLKKSESCGAKLTPSKSAKKETKENKKAQLAKDHPLFSDLDKVSRQKDREKREKHRLKKKKLSQHKEKHNKFSKDLKTNSSETKAKKITEVKLLEDAAWLGTASIDKKPLVKKQKSVVRDLSKASITTTSNASTVSWTTPLTTTTSSMFKPAVSISDNINKSHDPAANAWLMTPVTSVVGGLTNTHPISSLTTPVFSFPFYVPPAPIPDNAVLYTANQTENFQSMPISTMTHPLPLPVISTSTNIPLPLTTISTITNTVISTHEIMSSYVAPPMPVTSQASPTVNNTLPTADAQSSDVIILENVDAIKDKSSVPPENVTEVDTPSNAQEADVPQDEETKEEEEVDEVVVNPFVPMNEKEIQEKLEHEEEDENMKKNLKEYVRKHVENLEVLINKEKEVQLPVIIPKSKVLSKPKDKNPCKDKLNLYEEWGVIQKEVLERRKKIAAPIIPQAPQCYWEYMSLTGGYLLNNSRASWLSIPALTEPLSLNEDMRSLYVEHENERSRLRLQHAIQREKLIVSCEQEIMRVHSRAARTIQNQQMPLSACSVLLDKEVYCIEQRKKKSKTDVVESNFSSSSTRTTSVRDRFNARMFISWLQDVDDKFVKMKDALLARQRHEASALHAVQRTEWALKLSELDAQAGQHHWTSPHDVTDIEVPLVNISDDFELLPA